MAEWKSSEPCTACGLTGEDMVCEHHILTRKAYPTYQNEAWNRIPVCFKHHKEFHDKGNFHMANKYPNVKSWLEVNGWFFCETYLKWRKIFEN